MIRSTWFFLLGVMRSTYSLVVALSRELADLFIGWKWTRDPAPFIGQQMAITHHAAKVKHRTSFSSRLFSSTGYYSAAAAA